MLLEAPRILASLPADLTARRLEGALTTTIPNRMGHVGAVEYRVNSNPAGPARSPPTS